MNPQAGGRGGDVEQAQLDALAAGTLSIDRWNGGERVQLRLLDIAPAATGLRVH